MDNSCYQYQPVPNNADTGEAAAEPAHAASKKKKRLVNFGAAGGIIKTKMSGLNEEKAQYLSFQIKHASIRIAEYIINY